MATTTTIETTTNEAYKYVPLFYREKESDYTLFDRKVLLLLLSLAYKKNIVPLIDEYNLSMEKYNDNNNENNKKLLYANKLVKLSIIYCIWNKYKPKPQSKPSGSKPQPKQGESKQQGNSKPKSKGGSKQSDPSQKLFERLNSLYSTFVNIFNELKNDNGDDVKDINTLSDDNKKKLQGIIDACYYNQNDFEKINGFSYSKIDRKNMSDNEKLSNENDIIEKSDIIVNEIYKDINDENTKLSDKLNSDYNEIAKYNYIRDFIDNNKDVYYDKFNDNMTLISSSSNNNIINYIFNNAISSSAIYNISIKKMCDELSELNIKDSDSIINVIKSDNFKELNDTLRCELKTMMSFSILLRRPEDICIYCKYILLENYYMNIFIKYIILPHLSDITLACQLDKLFPDNFENFITYNIFNKFSTKKFKEEFIRASEIINEKLSTSPSKIPSFIEIYLNYNNFINKIKYLVFSKYKIAYKLLNDKLSTEKLSKETTLNKKLLNKNPSEDDKEDIEKIIERIKIIETIEVKINSIFNNYLSFYNNAATNNYHNYIEKIDINNLNSVKVPKNNIFDNYNDLINIGILTDITN